MSTKVTAIGTIAAAGLLAGTAFLPSTQALAANGAGTVVGSEPLNIRQSPDASAAKVGSYPGGAKVTFSCQTTGSKVEGQNGVTSDVWVKTDKGYVAAVWLDAGAGGGRISGVGDCTPGKQAPRKNTQNQGQGQLNRETLEAMFPGRVSDSPRVEEGLPHLEQEMAKREINTPARKAAFLATVAHESNFDYAIGEQGYDEYSYRGRGYIQITGEANYQSASEALGVDLMGDNQANASALPTSAQIAGWYWTEARTDTNAAADEFNMGRVSKNIGYDNTTGEDTERCESFKSAYKHLSGEDAPASLVCDRN